MGYLHNHLATVVCGAFAAVLTGLWPIFVDFAPIMNFIFIMAVPITWFLTFTCWIAQKSADYMKNYHGGETHHEKKSLSKTQSTVQVYKSDGKVASPSQINEARLELGGDLEKLRDTVKIKDSEIERLKQEIANLETLVQIESLKTELANLKALASERKSKR